MLGHMVGGWDCVFSLMFCCKMAMQLPSLNLVVMVAGSRLQHKQILASVLLLPNERNDRY